jgi:hypothetical protein
VQQVSQPDADELFEMANLFPRTTGLPMTVWVGPRGDARHDVRVKVNMTHGDQMNIANTAVVGVRPARMSSPANCRRMISEWYSNGYR